ncbi:DUF6090 family protein [Ichthyenterobacterium sp. W332]|uniref:DUF6090 family protein n=1 Tax=Microcosmobacter mediterraneus TaxID=3075607 RepID=A0ABU2YLU4_9FLAO|nr:DUF6090 family protein [Ichthyenterobacterium sp. W332]MDT0558795.1 DUF6090 family protein [Ichthyenterobacterium sp. W332]
MIKFFRRIRYNLMSENKTGKYFKYAIGEIVLVVIGILIALQINTWNQNRQNRSQEQQILVQLLNEYTNNLFQLNQKISIRNATVSSSFKLLNYKNDEKLNVVADSFNLHIGRILLRPTFDPELGVTTELTSSGKLYLITNNSLRNNITSFPSFLGELREEEMVIYNQVEEQLTPFIMEHYQIGRVIGEMFNDEYIKKRTTFVIAEGHNSVIDLFTQVDFKPLLNHPDFEDYLALMISNTIYTNEQSEGVKKKIEDIISLINKELEK